MSGLAFRLPIITSLFLLSACAESPLSSREEGLDQRGVDAPGDPTLRQVLQPPSLEASPRDSSAERVQAILDQPALTFSDLVEVAIEQNPEWQAARAGIGAAQAEALEASLYLNPALDLEAEEVNIDDGGFGSSETTIAIVQPIRTGGQREAAITVAEARERVAAAEAVETLRQIIGELRIAYVELISQTESLALLEELLEQASETASIARRRFEARATPETDVIRTEFAVTELELRAERVRGRRKGTLAQITRLLGGVALEPEALPGAALELPMPPPPLHEITGPATKTHPTVVAAGHKINLARRRVELARAEASPTIAVRLGYARNHETEDDMVEGGVSVPLAIFDRNQGAVLAARYDVIAARRAADAAAQRILADLTEAHATYESRRTEAEEHGRRILPPAERAFEQMKTGYEAGRLSLLDVLDAQRTLIEVRLSYLELLRDVNLAWARLWTIAGPTLQAEPAAPTEPEPEAEPEAEPGDESS